MSLPESKPKCIECDKEIIEMADWIQFPNEVINEQTKQIIRRNFINYHRKCV